MKNKVFEKPSETEFLKKAADKLLLNEAELTDQMMDLRLEVEEKKRSIASLEKALVK